MNNMKHKVSELHPT